MRWLGTITGRPDSRFDGFSGPFRTCPGPEGRGPGGSQEGGHEMTPFRKAVLETVARIPRGKVSSYGAVAAMAGQPRAARGVGWILNSLPPDTDLPWWRVVNARGGLSTRKLPSPAGQIQRELLLSEGIVFDARELIDDDEFWWRPDLDR